MVNYLLTISIPTYNRAKFLERNLLYLYSQKEDFDGKVEILVSDNASVDDSAQVVELYIAKGLDITYIKNEKNMGADYNIAQCYNEAKGKFVLAMGDDDILFKNSVKKILHIVSEYKDAGIVFLQNISFKDSPPLAHNVTDGISVKFDVYKNKKSFLHRVTYFFTFISANIVNKEFFKKVNTADWTSTNLVQLSVILTAFNEAPYNIIVSDKLLGAQIENSGGYNIFEVFGKNLNKITTAILNEDHKNIIMNDVFLNFLPYWTQRMRYASNFTALKIEETDEILRFNKYHSIITRPLLLMPRRISKSYFYGVKLYGFARKIFYFSIYRK